MEERALGAQVVRLFPTNGFKFPCHSHDAWLDQVHESTSLYYIQHMVYDLTSQRAKGVTGSEP